MQKYRVWCRRTNDPDALWADMPYAPRSKQACEELVDIYEEEWGQFYEYQVVAVRFFPAGLRQPCFVPR